MNVFLIDLTPFLMEEEEDTDIHNENDEEKELENVN